MFKALSIGSLFTMGYLTQIKYHSTHVNTLDKDLSTARNAICILFPHGDSKVSGLISFTQDNITSATKIIANVRGLKPNNLHGFHIHEYGDLTDGCTTAGPHYNPYGKRHGSQHDQERHVGDLGNLKSDAKGNAYLATTDHLIKLFGDASVIGRSCVVHNDEDDLGRGTFSDSETTGHSGARVACGVIALSQTFKNIPPSK